MSKKTSDEDPAGALDGTEEVRLARDGGNYRTTTQAIADLAPNSAGNPPAYNPQTTTAYTLQLTDAPASSLSQGIVSMNNAAANEVTVPPSSEVAWAPRTMIQVIQLGPGQTSIVAGEDVTVLTASSLNARAQNSTLLLTYLDSDEWMLSGDTE